jgi:hypothetical protein
MWPLISLLMALLLLLLAAGLLDRPIQQAVQSRWPAFHYDGPELLVIGVGVLGLLTMLVFILLMLEWL